MRKAEILQHVIAAMLALLVFMVSLPFIDSVLGYVDDHEPAIEWHSAKLLTPVVRPGEDLKFEYTRQHHRQCPSDLRRFILRAEDDIVVRFPLIPGGARRVEYEAKVVASQVTIPLQMDNGDPWVSGDYIYRMTAVRFCKHSIEYDTNVPDIKFTLKADRLGGGR